MRRHRGDPQPASPHSGKGVIANSKSQSPVPAVATAPETSAGTTGSIALVVRNLPASATSRKSLQQLISKLLKLEDVGTKGSPVLSVRIFKYSSSPVCAASVIVSDPVTATRLSGSLNGYSMDGTMVQCYIQPPPLQPMNTPPSSHYYQPQYYPYYQPQYGQYGQYSFNGYPAGPSYYAPSQVSETASSGSATPSSQSSPTLSYAAMRPQPSSQPPVAPGYMAYSPYVGYNYSYNFNYGSPPYGSMTSYSGSDSTNDLNAESDDEDVLVFNPRRHVSPCQLFIGNIPFASSPDSLRRFFDESAEGAKLVKLEVQRQINGSSKGYAVGYTVSKEDSVELIKQFNGKNFEGRDLLVRFNKQPEQILMSHRRRRQMLGPPR